MKAGAEVNDGPEHISGKSDCGEPAKGAGLPADEIKRKAIKPACRVGHHERQREFFRRTKMTVELGHCGV